MGGVYGCVHAPTCSPLSDCGFKFKPILYRAHHVCMLG